MCLILLINFNIILWNCINKIPYFLLYLNENVFNKINQKWCACLVEAIQKISLKARKARMNYVEEEALIKYLTINSK